MIGADRYNSRVSQSIVVPGPPVDGSLESRLKAEFRRSNMAGQQRMALGCAAARVGHSPPFALLRECRGPAGDYVHFLMNPIHPPFGANEL